MELKRDNIEVLPVGCDTDAFIPRGKKRSENSAVREAWVFRLIS